MSNTNVKRESSFNSSSIIFKGLNILRIQMTEVISYPCGIEIHEILFISFIILNDLHFICLLISHSLTIIKATTRRIAGEIHIVPVPNLEESIPPMPAPIAKIKIIPKK